MLIVTVIFTILFIFVIEIFTILFQLTGLSKDKSRFQVISILTGTGFTTKESELITTSKIRRNIAQAIMIFGFVSSATIVSLLFANIRTITTRTKHEYFIAFSILAVTYIVFKVSPIGAVLDRIIEKIATRAMFGKDTNVIVVKDSYENNVVIAEILINIMPPILDGKNMHDIGLNHNHGVMVLAIERDHSVITSVSWDTVLKVGDYITVFGDLNTINRIFYKEI